MKFPDHFLDELRSAVRVSEIVGRKFKLRKQGQELVAIDNPSLSVNDGKKLWKDFGNGGGKAGDIFSFLTDIEGLSFVDAVKACASIAGLKLPDSERPSGGASQGVSQQPDSTARPRSNGQPGAAPGVVGDAESLEASRRDQGRATRREIERTYDYTDEKGALIYQVVRFGWTTESGKRAKTFAQRRPAPDGRWIWGLDVVDKHDGEPLEFMTKAGRDWQRYDDKKFRDWKYEARSTFEQLGNLRHGFYKLPELVEALADGRPVFWCEGEKDAETLLDWGVPATTNSGGAKNVSEVDVSIFQGADVIIPLDNDAAGRERADMIGRRLKGVAKRVRTLDLVPYWGSEPAWPPKNPDGKGVDVTDWRDYAGGTVEDLYTILKEAPDWKPAPMVSRFGRVPWRDQEHPTRTPYEWLVKGLIPARASVAAIGPMGSGKSFETFNLGMHIATGAVYRGLRTKQALVVFCAPEGGAGVIDRMRAYRAEHNTPLDGVPFEALTRRFNLFASDADVEGLIAEVKQIEQDHDVPLGLVIIDTFSAATTGMDENSSKDVSTVRARLVRIETECRCTVLFVHHMNASGERQRGHSSITADVESVMKIEMLTRWENKQHVQVKDDNDRPIRRITNFKQREAATGQHWDFVLVAKEIRTDADGDRVTSCVSVIPARAEAEAPVAERKRSREGPKGKGYSLYREGEAEVFKAILAAINKAPEPAPAGVALPYGVRGVAKWSEVGLEYKAKVPNDEGDTPEGKRKYADRVKKTLQRARKAMLDAELIGVDQVGGEHPYHIVWPTGRAVWGPGLQWPEDGRRQPRDALAEETGSIADLWGGGQD